LRKRKTLDATGRERKSSPCSITLFSELSVGAHSHDQFCGKGRARESFFYADDWRIKFLKLPPEKNAAALNNTASDLAASRRTKEWESAAAEALFFVKEWLQMHAGTLGEVPSITVRPAAQIPPGRLLIMPVRPSAARARIPAHPSRCEPNLSFTRLDL